MIFVCTGFWLLAFLPNARSDVDVPSFRSSWHEEGKPILRTGPEGNDFEADPTVPKVRERDEASDWLQELRAGIYGLVQNYGYDRAKPYVKRLVDDTEKRENVLLHVEVNRDGTTRINYKQYMRAADSPPTPEPPPQWINDMKVFIKNLVEKYGRNKLDDHLKPVIKYVEKLNNVYIKDIDVDEFGEVIVNYAERPSSIFG